MPTTSGHSLLGNGIELEGGAQTSRIISAVDSQLHGLIHQQSCRGIFFSPVTTAQATTQHSPRQIRNGTTVVSQNGLGQLAADSLLLRVNGIIRTRCSGSWRPGHLRLRTKRERKKLLYSHYYSDQLKNALKGSLSLSAPKEKERKSYTLTITQIN